MFLRGRHPEMTVLRRYRAGLVRPGPPPWITFLVIIIIIIYYYCYIYIIMPNNTPPHLAEFPVWVFPNPSLTFIRVPNMC